MWREFAALGLGPVLLMQGHHVRRVTPRLPEPSGPREGEEGAGPLLRLLILGDSAAAGVGVASQTEALSGRLVSILARDRRVRWRLVAQTGHTAQDILLRVASEPAEAFDVAVTSIGVNDVTGLTRAGSWLATHEQLLEQLQARFGIRHFVLSSLPPMQVFPSLPHPLRWYLGLRAQRFNVSLRGWAQGRHDCEVVAVDFPQRPDFMAADGFHPGAAAYALWAEHLASAIRHRLP